METLIPIIRKILVIGIWVYVGFQMLPAARSTNRNGCLWYFFGLFSFYIPFAIIGFVPPVLMIIAMKNGAQISSDAIDLVGIIAFCAGVATGFACLHLAKRAAQKPTRWSR